MRYVNNDQLHWAVGEISTEIGKTKFMLFCICLTDLITNSWNYIKRLLRD